MSGSSGYPISGKIFLKFTAEQIEKSQMKGRFLIVNPANPNDFTIEKCVVHAVNGRQKFFKPGDTVLIDYSVFTVGKSQVHNAGKQKLETREILRETKPAEKGHALGTFDSIYWANDGTDPFNETEVFAKFEGDKIIMVPPYLKQPGWYLIEPAGSIRKSSIIHYEEKQDRTKPFYAKIIAVYEGSELQVGQTVLWSGSSSRPIFFDDKEFSIIKDKYAMALKEEA